MPRFIPYNYQRDSMVVIKFDDQNAPGSFLTRATLSNRTQSRFISVSYSLQEHLRRKTRYRSSYIA